MAEGEGKNEVYGKRPLWQWVLLYAVIGAIIYGLVYYFVLAKQGGNKYGLQTNQTAPVAAKYSGNIYTTRTDPVKGQYLAGFGGMTLYVFDKDTTGISNCYNTCAKTWPPYSSGAMKQGKYPQNITVIKRTDGLNQFAWKGLPLYYYAADQKPGDTTGDGVGGKWHLVKP